MKLFKTKQVFFYSFAIFAAITIIGFTQSCSNNEIDYSQTNDVIAKVDALANQYGVKVVSYRDDISTIMTNSKLNELELFLSKISQNKTFNCKFKTTYSNGVATITPYINSGILRVKQRSIENGSANSGFDLFGDQTTCIFMNLQWNSALDQGSLQLGSYGSTNPSLTLISSEVTRETGDCIDFNGYAKITQTIDGVTVSYIVHITGYVNTETNTANWSCGAMPGSY